VRAAFSIASPPVEGLWGRLLTVALLTLIVTIAGSVLFGSAGMAQLLALRTERQTLGEMAVAKLQENERLRDALRRMDQDAQHLEAMARRELGLVRPNEVVYRFRADEPAR
jgi:cell division protein FtsB